MTFRSGETTIRSRGLPSPLLGASTVFDDANLLGFEISTVHRFCSVVGGDTSTLAIDNTEAVTHVFPILKKKSSNI